MSHETQPKYEIATFAALPVLSMLFVEMALNFYAAPPYSVFISPYLFAFFVAAFISLIVLWKGEICNGQESRLAFVLKFLTIFAAGNFLYTYLYTPTHYPVMMSAVAAMLLPFIYWVLPKEEQYLRPMVWCGLGIISLGALLYLILYFFDQATLFNGIRSNLFAQVLLGFVLIGWYMMLAKSRLDGFFKFLIKLALIALVLSYGWAVFVMYQLLQRLPEMPLTSYFVFFAVQFVLFAVLGWLLLSKQGKNFKHPAGWTAALFLALLYPFANAF